MGRTDASSQVVCYAIPRNDIRVVALTVTVVVDAASNDAAMAEAVEPLAQRAQAAIAEMRRSAGGLEAA